MNRIYSLDRIEESTAVLLSQEGREVKIPREMLAAGAREGMLVRFREDAGLYCPEKAETLRRQAEMQRRVAALLQKGKESQR
ncbi:MAG: DUF3006 domain-containing protein [Faecalibacterium sp.]|jgi:hypothetical protein|nr:DUF3006 domain-containing protein [Faecalibacterium sp.]